VAVVTGASGSIGRAIAKRLAGDGALVAVHYHSNESAAGSVIADIESAGGRAFSVQADLGSVLSIRSMFERLDQTLTSRCGGPSIDILVHCAAVLSDGTFEKTDEATFDNLLFVNAKGPFFATQAALSRLRDGGRIIFISSIAARGGFPDFIAYAMAKGALTSLASTLALHLRPRGITVNALAPGPVASDLVAAMPVRKLALAQPESPLSLVRVGQPDDIAGAVSVLASAGSAWITGQYIEASGGFRL
jgi:NAD(P)-dependent dehydrogenase (short-subunit alcohol dehydrogenase family)